MLSFKGLVCIWLHLLTVSSRGRAGTTGGGHSHCCLLRVLSLMRFDNLAVNRVCLKLFLDT